MKGPRGFAYACLPSRALLTPQSKRFQQKNISSQAYCGLQTIWKFFIQAFKCCQSIEQKLCEQRGQYLFLEVLFRSKDYKVTVCQNLRMIQSSWTQTRAACIWLDSGRAAGFFLDLQLWQLVFLQSFDLQRPTIPLWKDLNLLCWLRFCPRD